MEGEIIRSYPVLELARPVNCFFTGVAVIIGSVVTFEQLNMQWIFPLIASVAAALIAAGGNSINDYFDQEIDEINRPERPIPSGRTTAKKALTAAWLFFAIGISLTIFLNIYNILLAALNSIILALYAWKLKRKGFVGNIAVGYLAGSTFLFGGLAISHVKLGSLIPGGLSVLVLMATFSTVGRELIKAIQDMQGDRQLGFITFPLMFGAGKAAVLAISFIGISVSLSPLPYLMGIFEWYYLAIVTLSIAAFATAAVMIGWRHRPATAGHASLTCKIGIGFGLVAFLVGVLAKLL